MLRRLPILLAVLLIAGFTSACGPGKKSPEEQRDLHSRGAERRRESRPWHAPRGMGERMPQRRTRRGESSSNELTPGP